MTTIDSEAFDCLFDEGGDVSQYVQWKESRKPGRPRAAKMVFSPARCTFNAA